MHFSRTLKSSTQCLPSPDGAYIATILPSSSKLSIRSTRSLKIVRVVTIPPELLSSLAWFLWSDSSSRLLVASADNIQVYSTTDSKFAANIKNPTSGTTKVTFVTFGATDDEICVFSDFGLKVSVVDLSTSKSVDITSPKFYKNGTAAKGISYRPKTKNLALLTRSGGKDIISIHARHDLEVIRSWHPETIDAQGITWSADGRWLVVWESASQGHRFFVYTADGHSYKAWNGPKLTPIEEGDIELGAGIKMFEWTRSGHIAVGDYSSRVTVLSTPSFAEFMNIYHTTGITPTETLKVWQEQIVKSHNSGFEREFQLATQPLWPPTSEASLNSNSEVKIGTNIMSFDSSGTLLATRTENMPTTLWVWDIGTLLLHTVMIFHAPVAKVTWHPTIDQLLMVRCENEESRGLVHIWDPSWENPQVINFAARMPGGEVIGKTIARWINFDSPVPAILFSDSQDCLLASISESEDEALPWDDAEAKSDICGPREDSLMSLLSSNERGLTSKVTIESLIEEDSFTRMSSGSEEADDTFQFRKSAELSDNLWT